MVIKKGKRSKWRGVGGMEKWEMCGFVTEMYRFVLDDHGKG